MIQRYTSLKVADNSGPTKVTCIGIPGFSNRTSASLGDIIMVVVKEGDASGVIKVHEKVLGVIVRTHKERRRKDGSYIRFDDNAIVMIDKDKNPRGTRIFGPVARELRDKGFLKIISLAEEVW